MANRKPARPQSILDGGATTRDAWDALVTDLEPHELTATRKASMEALALQMARMRDAAALINRDGLTVTDDNGVTRPHPALAIERDAATQIRDWTKHLP